MARHIEKRLCVSELIRRHHRLGAPIEKNVLNPVTGKKEKHCQGILTNIDATLSKDSIVTRISANMIPLAGGIKVEILTNLGGNRICIMEINRSNYAPHQTGHAYYMRLDGQTVHAPHHYVEALIKRVSYPNLEGYLKLHTPTWIGQNALRDGHYEANLEIWLFNFSPMENEEQLFFSLSTNSFKPIDRIIKSSPELKIDRSLDAVIGTNVAPVLTNGYPYIKTIPFEISVQQADDSDGTHFIFSLQFGGKKSPLKHSRYSALFRRQRLLFPDT